ncbi:hypothetical protein ACFWBN_29190 [Streptomyces sp. NPDC059989]|uniref:hypothetical protein n=1 Tax=Streptomyces sp. NPDC059989 TaxID=3347026 RepID=UPI00368B8059
MTDPTTPTPTAPPTPTPPPRGAGEATWALPLLALAPSAALGLFAERATPWLAVSWVCCALSALLLVAGWTTVVRHGMRGPAAWGTCVLAHAVLVTQLISLLRG